LVAADFESVGILAQMVGVMDRPAREPEHLLLELAQDLELAARKRFLPMLPGRAHALRSCMARDMSRLSCKDNPQRQRETRGHGSRLALPRTNPGSLGRDDESSISITAHPTPLPMGEGAGRASRGHVAQIGV